MTRFESGVFQSVLEQMAPDIDFPYGYTSIGESKNAFVHRLLVKCQFLKYY